MRRIVHWNTTEHPTAGWTVQQFRAMVPGDQPHRFLIHDALRQWVAHYNQGRPHASLGPGIPDVPLERLARLNGHQIPDGHRVIAAPILAGLHAA